MKNVLVIVDMQKDFINGSLGTPEAEQIVSRVATEILNFNSDNSFVAVTKDTHRSHYLDTLEGKNLPIEHCIKGTEGHELDPQIKDALTHIKNSEVFEKCTFGSVHLAHYLHDMEMKERINSIEIVGLCTDICVISNALTLKAFLPEVPITVKETCCAGTTPEKHKEALDVMRSCQINII